MNYKKLCVSLMMLSLSWWLARYIDRTRIYRLDEMSEFLAMCGTFIQTSFGVNKPGTWDYFLVLISVLVVIYALVYSVKYMVKPAEQSDHIKFKIFEDE